MNTSEVIGIYTGLLVFLFIIIFVYYIYFKSEDFLWRGSIVTVLVLTISSCITVVIKSSIGQTLEAGDIILSNLFSVGVIIVPLLLVLYMFPIIGRAFENTVGYFFLNKGDLTDVTSQLFNSHSGNKYDYNLFITQLFDDGADMVTRLKTAIVPFKDIYLMEPVEDKVDRLKNFVSQKHGVSEATFVSLATIVSSMIVFLPVLNQF